MLWAASLHGQINHPSILADRSSKFIGSRDKAIWWTVKLYKITGKAPPAGLASDISCGTGRPQGFLSSSFSLFFLRNNTTSFSVGQAMTDNVPFDEEDHLARSHWRRSKVGGGENTRANQGKFMFSAGKTHESLCSGTLVEFEHGSGEREG